jgi:hypothetical protein
VLGGGVCRPRADLMFLSRPQGRRSPFVQMQAPARGCCQLRACMTTGYRSNLWEHIGMPLAGSPDNAGYRGLGPRFCSQRYCNSLTGTSDDRPRSQAAVNQPTRNSAPPSTGSATPVMKLASTHARGFSSPLVGPRSRFLASSRWTCSRFLVSSCRTSRFLVSSCRPARGFSSPLVDYSRFPGSSSPRAVESIHSTPRISCYSADLEIRGQVNAVSRLLSSDPTRGFSSPLVGPRSRFLVSSR